ncbi:PREDICTED: decaprenyl-diphosphate synthase subunit 1 [Hipposideros armiger]|uniref:Decaprenyl-diphosphate synthase subunit 1 n=1 Tax=Hipposideros armiger TaxID=186990 RepID=A0A8B7QM40_HIPAR|nr:PREDICTED: decaprenyl-diphosphate synthase subunit 1 [Hipposideros armiger]
MASCWWRWRRGCSWRPAARSPGRGAMNGRAACVPGGGRGAPGPRWGGAPRPQGDAERWARGACLPEVGAPRSGLQSGVLGAQERFGLGEGAVFPRAPGKTQEEWSDCRQGYGPSQNWRPSAPLSYGISYFNLVKSLTSAFPNMYSLSRLYHTTSAVDCCSKTRSGEKYTDPFKLGWRDLKGLYEDIRKELLISPTELKEMSQYYFDGKGKAFRPIIVVLMARACNIHHNNSRCKYSTDIYSQPKEDWKNIDYLAVLAGDLILSAASMALARIGNTTVISILTQVIEDLVRGEFLQLGSKENENERFAHYLEKTFKKTASLIANSCKAVSVLGCPDPVVHEIAYQYGKNVGIAFQLIDDVLDFTSCSDQMGKPTSADLKLGLATGPVLFACQQFPEMNAMIMRRFSLPGDVDRARQYVLQSDGVQQTTYLAQRYCHEAIREISKLRPSPERDALIQLSETVLTRDK